MLTIIGIAVFLSVLAACFAVIGYYQRNPIVERINLPKKANLPKKEKRESSLVAFWRLSELCPLTFEQALTVGIVGAAVAFSLTALLFHPLAAVACGVLCFLFLPRLAVNLAVNKRVKNFKATLGFGADMLLAGLSAGMTLEAALEEASRTSPEPVKSEFARIAEEIKSGESPVKAFDGLARRIPCTETEELRDAVELYSQVGGPKALELIRVVVANLREDMNARFQTDQYVRGAKITAVMVTLVPIGYVMVMALIAPDLFNVLIGTSMGRTVIFVCLVIFGAGLWLLWNILCSIEKF